MNGEPIVMMTKTELRELVIEAVTEALETHEPAAPALLDRNELAYALRVSPRTVARLRKEGMPVTWVLESPRFELARVLEWLRDNSAHLGGDGQTPVPKLDGAPSNRAGLTLVPTAKRKPA